MGLHIDVCRPPLLLINTGVAALLNQKVSDPGDLVLRSNTVSLVRVSTLQCLIEFVKWL